MLTKRAAWLFHDGPLPIMEGTVIRLNVERLPSGGDNKPVRLWWSRTDATPADVDRTRPNGPPPKGNEAARPAGLRSRR